MKLGTVAAVLFSWVVVTSTAQSCPVDFDEFIRKFESGGGFQLAHTQFPLRYQYVDSEADPEPKLVEIMVAKERAADFSGIIFPSPARQASVPLQRKISSPNSDTHVVAFEKPDTDYLVSFTFKKSVACWELVSVEDASL